MKADKFIDALRQNGRVQFNHAGIALPSPELLTLTRAAVIPAINKLVRVEVHSAITSQGIWYLALDDRLLMIKARIATGGGRQWWHVDAQEYPLTRLRHAEVKMRWVSTCEEATVTFRFDGDEPVTVTSTADASPDDASPEGVCEFIAVMSERRRA